MAQAHGSAQKSLRRQRLRQQAAAHIIPRSKRCVLAQTFLRGRQWRRRTEVREGALGDKDCVSRLLRILYRHVLKKSKKQPSNILLKLADIQLYKVIQNSKIGVIFAHSTDVD